MQKNTKASTKKIQIFEKRKKASSSLWLDLSGQRGEKKEREAKRGEVENMREKEKKEKRKRGQIEHGGSKNNTKKREEIRVYVKNK